MHFIAPYSVTAALQWAACELISSLGGDGATKAPPSDRFVSRMLQLLQVHLEPQHYRSHGGGASIRGHLTQATTSPQLRGILLRLQLATTAFQVSGMHWAPSLLEG